MNMNSTQQGMASFVQPPATFDPRSSTLRPMAPTAFVRKWRPRVMGSVNNLSPETSLGLGFHCGSSTRDSFAAATSLDFNDCRHG